MLEASHEVLKAAVLLSIKGRQKDRHGMNGYIVVKFIHLRRRKIESAASS